MNEFELSEAQVSMLRDICNKRYKLLVSVFIALPAFLSYALLRPNFFPGDTSNDTIAGFNIVITALLLSTLAYLYFRKVSPVRKDIMRKAGKYDNKIIVNKTEFPYANQYYIFFEDEKLPSKEITRTEFLEFNIGDVYSIPLGKNSNLVLDGFMNYDLL